MKKAAVFLLSAFMMFALCSCSANNIKSESSAVSSQNSSQTEKKQSQTAKEMSKILVVYFSCTNNTKTLAQYVADSLGADIYEITPKVDYTPADLNYNDDTSRTTKEQNDKNCRPEISGSVKNMEQYDTVFVAYPIWWGDAPRILSTFMESYDFSGKTVIPFCTSGSSGIGESAKNLEKLTNKAKWLSGRRFAPGTSKSEMVSWVNGLGITSK